MLKGLPGIKGRVGTAPHFGVVQVNGVLVSIEEKMYQPIDDPIVKRCQRILAGWYVAKIEEANEYGESSNHWTQYLQKFIQKTNLDVYISPFTGKIDIGNIDI